MIALMTAAGIIGMIVGMLRLANPGKVSLDERKKGFRIFLGSLALLLLSLALSSSLIG